MDIYLVCLARLKQRAELLKKVFEFIVYLKIRIWMQEPSNSSTNQLSKKALLGNLKLCFLSKIDIQTVHVAQMQIPGVF